MNTRYLHSTQIDAPLTLALAQASVAAYNDYKRLPYTAPLNYSFWSRFTGWDDWLGSFGAEERFGLIFKYNGISTRPRFIVAFRGTASLSDLYEDAFWDLTGFQPYHGSFPAAVNVSTGFYDIYATKNDSMARTMQQQLFYMLPDNAEVFVTGHSLGGALSQLFTLDLRVSMPFLNVQTINFASPRVGDNSWEAACNRSGATDRITRVVNYWDLVPDYPAKFLSYVSIGQQFSIAFSRYHWYETNFISDHSLLNYQMVLSHCLWQNPPVWEGTFADAIDTNYLMLSTAVPTMTKEEWMVKMEELHTMKIAMLGSRPVVNDRVLNAIG